VCICIACAIPFLVLIAVNPKLGDKHLWDYSWIVATAWLIRTALMNCFSPISKSVLNDYAPRSTRGRWNSMSSFQQMGWSGSALLGGLLISNYSYYVCFFTTAGLQVCGLLLRSLMLPLVPAREEDVAVRGARSDSIHSVHSDMSGTSEGLAEGLMDEAVEAAQRRFSSTSARDMDDHRGSVASEGGTRRAFRRNEDDFSSFLSTATGQSHYDPEGRSIDYAPSM